MIALGLFLAFGVGEAVDAEAAPEDISTTSGEAPTEDEAVVATTTGPLRTPTTTTPTPPAGTTSSTTTTIALTTTTAQPALDPARIYAAVCAECHGVNREGDVGPSLGPDGHFAGHTDEQLVELIAQGRGGMPAWQGILSEEEMLAIIGWLRSELGDAGEH